MDDLWELIRKIPRGKVASYGSLGRALRQPVSGLLVGRAMARCPKDIPWWRVVSRDGKFVIHKRDPIAAEDQRQRLILEGAAMTDDDTVTASAFIDPDLLR